MEPGPVPPHERAWRHPSELAAEERAALQAEEASPTTRTFALTTGMLGLVALGVLILVVTPRSQDAPIAITATTSPAPAVVESGVESSVVASVRNTLSTIGGGIAVATPIGDGEFAVMTRAATPAPPGSRIDVLVPSNGVVAGEIVDEHGGALLVRLAEHVPGHAVAERRPESHATVTVMSDPPVEVSLSEVAGLDVREGTAVFDDAGELVGLCTRDRISGRRMIVDVSDRLAGATSDDR